MGIQTIGIIGAGTMGNGIAQACAVVGLDAIMQDVSEAALDKGVKTVSGSLDRLVKKGTMSEADKAAAMLMALTVFPSPTLPLETATSRGRSGC